MIAFLSGVVFGIYFILYITVKRVDKLEESIRRLKNDRG